MTTVNAKEITIVTANDFPWKEEIPGWEDNQKLTEK